MPIPITIYQPPRAQHGPASTNPAVQDTARKMSHNGGPLPLAQNYCAETQLLAKDCPACALLSVVRGNPPAASITVDRGAQCQPQIPQFLNVPARSLCHPILRLHWIVRPCWVTTCCSQLSMLSDLLQSHSGGPWQQSTERTDATWFFSTWVSAPEKAFI